MLLMYVPLCRWSIGGCVAYAILAYHSGKVDNVMIAAATPGGPDSYLPPQSVLDDILKIKTDYHALLPYLFPRGAMDDGEQVTMSHDIQSCYTCCVPWCSAGLLVPVWSWTRAQQSMVRVRRQRAPEEFHEVSLCCMSSSSRHLLE